MSETTAAPEVSPAPKKAPVKKAPKKPAKKAPTKKAPTKKAPKAKKAERADRGPSKTQVEVLKVLSRSTKGMTRSEISERLDGAFIGADLMGHFDPKKLKAKSLLARGLVKFAAPEEDRAAAYYTITAAGRKAIGK